MSVETELWAHIDERLRERLTSVAMTTWFRNCRIMELTDTTLILHTPMQYTAEIIEERFGTMLREVLAELLPGEYMLQVLHDDTLRAYEAERAAGLDEDEDFTFERFVVGNTNKFAHAAAVSVANGHFKDFNPLFIYGNSGLGKTHLLRAIRHTIHERFPDFNIVYIKGDDFTNDLIAAIQAGKNVEFREKYRQANVFLMDDIQFIAGKVQTQEEFFHTFNTLYEAGRQIVLTSDRPPNEIAKLEDRLRTRFESGLMADVQPPDYETRMAIILNKAQEFGFTLQEEIADFVAKNLSANVRQLEGAVKQIYAYSGIKGEEKLTIAEVKKRIKDMIRETERAITADLIVEETSSFFQLAPEDLRGQRRTRNTAHARQVAMYLIRTLTPLSLADIGGIFEGRDHSTVLNAIRNVETELGTSAEFGQTLRDITANIQSKADQ
ncbi:MAG: chromosomal replication initiator protein DnaA [Oscillospiraceae bacterium]|jgi:chromosomal replication initiator protein|nr:chromosomal replication initiator protein DnaA [Oscillospiraceae bacterium]